MRIPRHRESLQGSSRDTASRMRDHTESHAVRPQSNTTLPTFDGHPTTPRVVAGIVPRHLESHQGPFFFTTYKAQSEAKLHQSKDYPTTPRVVLGIALRRHVSHKARTTKTACRLQGEVVQIPVDVL